MLAGGGARPRPARRGARRGRARRARSRSDAEIIGVNARDLTTSRSTAARSSTLVADAPRDRVVVAESGIGKPRPGRRGRAGRRRCDPRRLGAHAGDDPAAKLAELLSRPLVKVCGLTREEDVAARPRPGADLAGFVLAESPRRAEAPLPVPETMLSVASASASPGTTPPISSSSTRRGRPPRARRRPPARGRAGRRAGPPLARRGRQPLGRGGRRASGRILLAGGLGPENVRAAIEAVGPGASTPAGASRLAPGSRIRARVVRAFVEACARDGVRSRASTAPTAAATSPRRSCRRSTSSSGAGGRSGTTRPSAPSSTSSSATYVGRPTPLYRAEPHRRAAADLPQA